MSDTVMSLLPTDRHFTPSPAARDHAVKLLRAFAPVAGDVTGRIYEAIEFIDCGGNWSGVRCPACGADAEQWFTDELSRCFEQSQLRDLGTVAACCGAAVSLDTLVFGWPVGFARFVLDVRNPGLTPPGFTDDQHLELEAAVGCPLRTIWRRY